MKKTMLICAAGMLGLLLLLSACRSADVDRTETEREGTPTAATEIYTDIDGTTVEETVTDAQSETAFAESLLESTQPVEETVTDAQSETALAESLPECTQPTETEPPTYETVEIPENAEIYQLKPEITSVGKLPLYVDRLPQKLLAQKTHLQMVPPLGYACRGFEINGVCYEGDTIPVAMLTEDAVSFWVIEYATYELPILQITVGGKPIESKTEYVDMTLSLENTDSPLLNVPGGLRLRGNSTATYEKKPYRIKFEQKQSLFGLSKAKSWVLLAEYLDPSCMHNYAAMSLGQASDALAFTPTVHQVNLYLDGEYMGIYSLCEQVEEKEGRLDLEIPITADMTELMDYNFLVCMDERAPEYPDAKEGETYFYVASVGRYFELKYPRKEDFADDAQFEKFFSELETFYGKMANSFLAGSASWISKNVHLDSLIDHLIIDQVMGERDHIWKSFYTYHEKRDEQRCGRISFGPIWDYDYALYTPWTSEPNVYYEVGKQIEYSNFFFQGLMKSRLAGKVYARYKSYYADVLADTVKDLQAYEDSISESLALNQERWYRDDPEITEKNVDFLIKFLKQRQKILRQVWK